MPEVFISGPVGRIQGHYTSRDKSMVALIIPPHPKQGGTMNNRTVRALSKAFIDNNFSTLRMNFRGVQRSEDSFNHNFDDEFLKDASAAISWLQEQNSIISEFWIAGFSFGAWMSMNLVMRRPETTGFIAVSPPVERYDFSFIFPCPIPGLIVQGGEDNLNSEEEVAQLANKLQSRVKGISYSIIEGGDYKYSNPTDLEKVYKTSYSYIKDSIENEIEYGPVESTIVEPQEKAEPNFEYEY